MTKPRLRDTWIVGVKQVKDGQARRIVSFVADTPEDALRLFAGTIWGRSDKYKVTQVYEGAPVYVEESNDTSDDD
jgi:hypothetical protein